MTDAFSLFAKEKRVQTFQKFHDFIKLGPITVETASRASVLALWPAWFWSITIRPKDRLFEGFIEALTEVLIYFLKSGMHSRAV